MSGSATGLNPGFIRQPPPAMTEVDGEPLEIIVSDDNAIDMPKLDDKGNIIEITHPDGSISVSLDGRPLGESEKKQGLDWYSNLVDDIDAGELSRISSELMRGIEDDIQSRQDWIEDRAQGIKLLGLKLETPGLQGSADGAPVEGMSKVRHPLLLEAVLRFQANARSELLPTDGPVKIRNDGNGSTPDQDQLANALEKDMNHYLTSVATEYYPDTDRMLLMLGFGGTAFKKVYFCPLRNRPVSESVDADDMIVNQAATDLANAKRVTHRSFMRPSTVKRLQILGVYRDIDLAQPQAPKTDAVQQAKNSQQGVADSPANPLDRDREVYECYCELDIRGFEHEHKGQPSGLEIPYVVTIDQSSREILAITRNYAEDDQELPTARKRFVKYTFTPGMGFYDIGLLHILGNTTNAITAAWRELLDSGMYANFPGFLLADTGARQNTNIFRIPPGGAALVKTAGMPMSQAVMPLPYNSQAAPSLMALVDNMAQTGARIGGTSEQQVGEGRADAPVGTTLANIDQATKILNSVHKRMHAAQAEEFQMLMDVFKEHPESFCSKCVKPTYAWTVDTFAKALEDCDLVPQADPNTASHSQRVMKVFGLMQLMAANPTMYDPIAVNRMAIIALGYSNPEQFMAPPSAMGAPPPEIQKDMAEIAIKRQDAETRKQKVQLDAVKMQHEMQQRPEGQPGDTPADNADAQAKLMAAHTKAKEVDVRAAQAAVDDRNRDLDRKSREEMQLLALAKDVITHPESAGLISGLMAQVTRDGDAVNGTVQ